MKLLKYINSVSMGVKHEITNLRQALALIGLNNFKKWASVLIMAAITDDKPIELMRLSLFRGRFCELISIQMGKAYQSEEYFLAGIFSLMDTALSKPMKALVVDLPLSENIIETLLGHDTKLQVVLALSRAMEIDGNIENQLKSLRSNISLEKLYEISEKSIAWADQILRL